MLKSQLSRSTFLYPSDASLQSRFAYPYPRLAGQYRVMNVFIRAMQVFNQGLHAFNLISINNFNYSIIQLNCLDTYLHFYFIKMQINQFIYKVYMPKNKLFILFIIKFYGITRYHFYRIDFCINTPYS